MINAEKKVAEWIEWDNNKPIPIYDIPLKSKFKSFDVNDIPKIRENKNGKC